MVGANLQSRLRLIASLVCGRMQLRLSSRHRVTTRYNAYSRLLTRYMMSNFQADLLRIIKTRCEARREPDRS